MKKWIKLEDVPIGFYGNVFLASFERGVEDEIYTISRRSIREPLFQLEYDSSWNSFRSDIDYRVMIIEYPTITDEDFK